MIKAERLTAGADVALVAVEKAVPDPDICPSRGVAQLSLTHPTLKRLTQTETALSLRTHQLTVPLLELVQKSWQLESSGQRRLFVHAAELHRRGEATFTVLLGHFRFDAS